MTTQIITSTITDRLDTVARDQIEAAAELAEFMVLQDYEQEDMPDQWFEQQWAWF